jgi:hypothetical protein
VDRPHTARRQGYGHRMTAKSVPTRSTSPCGILSSSTAATNRQRWPT